MGNDQRPSSDADVVLRVELAAWLHRLPSRTRRQVRRASIAAVVLGGALVLLAVVGAVAFLATRPPSPELAGAVFLAALGGLLVWTGAGRLRWVPATDLHLPVRFTAPYAFELGPDTVRFPGYAGHPPEEWPLARTTVEVVPGRWGERLQLTAPGHRRRRYPARGLAEPPHTVADQVRLRQSSR